MGVYNLTADNVFLLSLTETRISLREITGDLLSRNFGTSDWREVARIGVTSDSNYNELGINGVVIGGQLLKDLAFDLWKSRLHVNRQGYCFAGQGVLSISVFGLERYRFNDLFSWSKYGVNVSSSTTLTWDRCNMYTGKPVINMTEQHKLLLADYESKMREKVKEVEICNKKLLEAKDDQLKAKDNEVIMAKKGLEDKDKELIECRLKLENNKTELALVQKERDEKLKENESQLREKEKELRNYQSRLRMEEEKLSLCKKLAEVRNETLKECKSQLRRNDRELFACKNQVTGLNIAVHSLANSLSLLTGGKEVAYNTNIFQAPNPEVSPIKIGPWPAQGSENWTFNAPGKGGIKEITVKHGWVIDSLEFVVVDGSGKTETKKFGGEGGEDDTKITLNWPIEYIKSISGTTGSYLGNRVTSLSFHTNENTYGPFGTSDNDVNGDVMVNSSFTIPIQDGSIIGFHGSAGTLIDTIGVYAQPNLNK